MDTVLRVSLIYFFLMAAMRVVGKREFGQLGPFDLVVLLLIPEMLTDALTAGDDSLTNGLVGVATLLVLVFLTSRVAYRFTRAGELREGQPTVLARHGALVPANMDRERITPGEVLDAMHAVGLEAMDQVKWALLGSDGRISVIPWEPGASRPRPRSGFPH
jgi:uncharacterized membrane protein YcaP (DUF421 family)